MKIGKRVVKTALAIFASVLIYIVLMLFDMLFNLDRNEVMFAPTNWYTPFFAGIAAGYAVQNNPQRSIRQAQIRSFGSLIGGTFGAIVIHIYEEAYLLITGVNDIELLQNNIYFKLIEFIFVSFFVIFLIPLAVKLKRSNAVFISILTYLSVTISIRNGGMDVFFFAFNRILSTIVGVQIALLINSFDALKPKNKDILFISSFDSAKVRQVAISPFTIFEINNLYNYGCDLIFCNGRTLTSVASFLKNMKVNNPTFLLDGLITYDQNSLKYYANKEIESKKRVGIEELINKTKSPYFTYQVNDNRFSCYYNELSNDAILRYYNHRIDNTHYTFSKALAPIDMPVSLYYVIDKTDKIEKLKESFKSLPYYSELELKIEKSNEEGFSDLKIRPAGINNGKLVKEYATLKNKNYIISFVSKDTCDEIYDLSDFTYCLGVAPDYIKEKVNYVLDTKDPDALIKFVYKIYFKKNYKKYLEKIRIR